MGLDNTVQISVFLFLTFLVAFITYLKCSASPRDKSEKKDYFLAGGNLSWIFVSGSMIMTNISAEQIVGMNGVQKILTAWWEIFAAIGLLILARFLIPVYFKYNCTTTTELLEHKYKDKSIRSLVSCFFMMGYLFILLPTVLYTGSLFMVSMFQIDFQILGLSSITTVALAFTLTGASYAIFGGLRAIAISDSLNGIGFIVLGTVVSLLSLEAISWDFSGIPSERMTLIGSQQSEIPWKTLLTGMIFIQVFYWGTNMVITQRALGAKSVKEAQKALYVTALAKIFIPFLVVVPGVVAFKLYGDLGDKSYGRLVQDLLPPWLSGAFAATMTGAVLSSFNSCLNAASALYTCDIHHSYINKTAKVSKIGTLSSVFFALISLCLVPLYENSQSIIGLLQKLNGLYSMPVLAAFFCAFFFKGIKPFALKLGMLVGFVFYGTCTFIQDPLVLLGVTEEPFHFIHQMFLTFFFCVMVTVCFSWAFKTHAVAQRAQHI